MSARTTPTTSPPTFQPRLVLGDAAGAYWLRQATLRLRREICWTWVERSLLTGEPLAALPGALPPFTDPTASSLDLARYDDDKRAFFEGDVTAAYLSELIAAPASERVGGEPGVDGGFGWVARELELAPVECFVLALALLAGVDAAAGPVIAACLNDPQRPYPTAGLAQRLWDRPEEILAVTGHADRLRHAGLLDGGVTWNAALIVPGPVATQLLFPASALPRQLAVLPAPAATLGARELELVAARVSAASADRCELVPLVGATDSPLAQTAAQIAAACGRAAAQAAPGTRADDVGTLTTLAWLRGVLLYVPLELLASGEGAIAVALPTVPLTILVGIDDPAAVKRLPAACTLAPVALPAAGYDDRLAAWRGGLARYAAAEGIPRATADCARRLRCEVPVIERLCRTLNALERAPGAADLIALCRENLDLGALARRVTPRFARADLMLPGKQTRQVEELIAAAEHLSTVHHEWGTAQAWNESGISALFAGPSGTGKTMAAEVIAAAVGVPLFRIDLSQVVNKYIGETEKNLARLFDIADTTEAMLFFDEADSLFGKRTEVKDAHDRFANLEVSYLLERMERFRGIAILATNRKRDLDDAFLRRLRFLIDFPLPGPAERRRIWEMAIPPGVDARSLDLSFLAERFTLAGGHIRSIVFQACLQSAKDGAPRRLEMEPVIAAVRRELEKLDRTISLEQFGPYAHMAED